MKSDLITARWVGVLFLLATLTYGIGSGMVGSVVDASSKLSKIASNPQPINLGAMLMLVNCLAVVAIRVLMFPLLRRHSEAVAVGYMTARAVEGTLLAVGGGYFNETDKTLSFLTNARKDGTFIGSFSLNAQR